MTPPLCSKAHLWDAFSGKTRCLRWMGSQIPSSSDSLGVVFTTGPEFGKWCIILLRRAFHKNESHSCPVNVADRPISTLVPGTHEPGCMCVCVCVRVCTGWGGAASFAGWWRPAAVPYSLRFREENCFSLRAQIFHFSKKDFYFKNEDKMPCT